MDYGMRGIFFGSPLVLSYRSVDDFFEQKNKYELFGCFCENTNSLKTLPKAASDFLF